MKKSIILGFDGASPDLIKKWSEENELPNFKKIIDEGVFGELSNPATDEFQINTKSPASDKSAILSTVLYSM